MARLLLLFSLFISFGSYSETINKDSAWLCEDADNTSSLGYSPSASSCTNYAPVSKRYPICDGAPYHIYEWSSHNIKCPDTGNGDALLIRAKNRKLSSCPSSHPVDNGDGTCSTNDVPEPEPHSCPDAGTFITTTWGRDGLSGWSTCRSDNCVAAVQRSKTGVCYRPSDDAPMKCEYDLFYTGQACSYDPNKPGVNPPEHEYPDEPVTPPDPDQPPSPDIPEGGGDGVEPPIYDPDGEGDGKPDDPVQPPNPDPTPDPDDPNLSDGENAVVGELSEANQRLENIDHTTQELTNTIKSDNDSLLEYQAHLLGEMKQMNQQLADGVGGGGGGGNGDGDGDGSCEGEDCTPVAFPGAPEVVDPFAEILDETDINDILTRTAEVKTEIQTQMNNFKGLFKVPDYGTGGNIAPVEFDLNHNSTTIPVKFGIFGDISEDISAIIIMIAAFIAFLIVTTRR